MALNRSATTSEASIVPAQALPKSVSNQHRWSQSNLQLGAEPTTDDGNESDPQSFFVRALYDYSAPDDSSLSFVQGDVIEVLTQLKSGWWDGLLADRRGWFPSNFVEIVDEKETNAHGSYADYHGYDDSRFGEAHANPHARAASSAPCEALTESQVDHHESALPGLEKAFAFSATTYPSDADFSSVLGLEQDFATLRELMESGTEGANLVGTSDAFDQLAEAAVFDANRPSQQHLFQDANGSSSMYRTRMNRTASGPTGQPSLQSDPPILTRPRAASGLAPALRYLTLQWQSESPRDGASVSASASAQQRRQRKATTANDFWVPKVTSSGEIVYFNTRTGEQSNDLPDGEKDDFVHGDTSLVEWQGQEVSEPNGQGTIVGQTGYDKASTRRSLPAGHEHETDDFFSRFRSSTGPGLLSGASKAFAHYHRLPLLERDERETLELQKLLVPSDRTHPMLLVRRVSEALSALAEVCSEEVKSDGLSDVDRALGEADPQILVKGGVRMQRANQEVMAGIRNLLYTTGILGVDAFDLMVVSELASLSVAEERLQRISTFHPSRATLIRNIANSIELAALVPPSLRQEGSNFSSIASKLVLSVRAVIEQHAVTVGRSDNEIGALYPQHLNSLRQRVQENALALLEAVESFAAELGRSLAQTSQDSPSWIRTIEASLRSAKENAGVSHESLGGGSAGGWKGNGFVLPTALDVAVWRAFSAGFAPSQQPQANRDWLLYSASENLIRRPTELLTQSYLRKIIRPHLEDLLSQLDSLLTSLPETGRSHHDSHSDTSPSSEAARATVGDRTVLQVIDVSSRLGTLVALLEDIDFASALDVDGPGPVIDTRFPREGWEALAISARDGLQRYSRLKQGTYDGSSRLLIDCQKLSSCMARDEASTDDALRQLADIALALEQAVKELFDVTLDLAQIAEEQKSLQLPTVGARAHVNGVEEAARSLASVRSHTQSSETLATAMTEAVAPQSNHRTKSLLLSQISRDRSASVATGHSAPEPGQVQKIEQQQQQQQPDVVTRLTRRYTEGEEVARAEGELTKASATKSSRKFKRFFGDESNGGSSTSLQTAGSVAAPPSDAQVPVRRPKAVEDAPFLQPDYAPEDIVFTAEGQVKGATLPALVERLTMHNSFDATFNNTFLMTYRSFTPTATFLDMLFCRFRIQPPTDLTTEELAQWAERKQGPTRLRVFNVLKSWLEQYFYEGEDDEHLASIKRFADEMQEHSMELPSRQLLRLVERRQGEGEQMVRKMVLPTVAPPPVLPKSLRKVKFLDIDPVEMARQLTLLESRLYNRIKPTECLNKAWSKTGSDAFAKGIKDTINTSNRITGWVAEAILVQEDLKKRVAWIKHFIAIADSCRLLQNFSTMTAIVSGLNSAPVYRLKRSWDAISGRYIAVLENLNRIMQSSKNFADYREMIHQLQPPCVPFLGVYLTDLTFIEDGNTDRLKSDERLINFGKRQKTAEVIREIMIYQATPYSLTPVAGIQKFIEDNLVEARSDGELYTQSLNLEPREREDEKISRLLAESGFL